ncbi:hypothetical protein J6590_104028 [Homalodisca vitripennis]|nr:hypothetical protein J6590_104028 [Homalodisca vitripennis]
MTRAISTSPTGVKILLHPLEDLTLKICPSPAVEESNGDSEERGHSFFLVMSAWKKGRLDLFQPPPVKLKRYVTLRPFSGGGPSMSTLQRLVAKFEKTGSVNNQPTPRRERNSRSIENVATVRESVQRNPRQSIPRRAQELGLSQTSTW